MNEVNYTPRIGEFRATILGPRPGKQFWTFYVVREGQDGSGVLVENGGTFSSQERAELEALCTVREWARIGV